MQPTAPLLSAVLLTAAGVDAAADPPGRPIDISIVNSSGDDLDVEVFDNLCGDVVASGRLVGKSELAAQVCSQDMNRGDVSVRDLRSGAEQRYTDVLDGANLEAP